MDLLVDFLKSDKKEVQVMDPYIEILFMSRIKVDLAYQPYSMHKHFGDTVIIFYDYDAALWWWAILGLKRMVLHLW